MLPNCYHCGGPGELPLEDGSAVCYDCDENFQNAMRAEYPFGQCGQCGAAYEQVTCHLDIQHVVARHVEGACSNWRDTGGYELGDGECFYGCRPLAAAKPRADWFETDDDLPF